MDFKYKHGGPYERDEIIRINQSQLNDIRVAFNGNWLNLNTDGILGRNTRDALKSFQSTYGLSPTGNLDQSTQDAIAHYYRECKRSHNAEPNPSRGYNMFVTYANPDYVKTTNYTIGPPVVPRSSFPSVYEVQSKESFIEEWKGIFEQIFSFISSTIQNAINGWKSWESAKILFGEISDAVKRFSGKLENAGQRLRMLGDTIYVSLTDLTEMVHKDAKAQAAKAAEELKGKSKASTTGKVFKVIDWAIPTIELIYYSIRYAMATPEEAEEYRKKVSKAADALFKQICNSVIMKIIEIAATRVVTGFVAGSVAPGAGNVVGTVIGIILTVIDIILYIIFGKTVGDYIWDAISPTLKAIGNNFLVVLEKAPVYYDNAYMGLNGRRSYGPKY